MSNTKKLIIMVVILLVMSAIFNFLVRGSIRSAFTLPWASKDVSKTYEVKDSFKEIDVETDVSDITIIPIKNGKARVSRQGSSSLTFHLQTSGNKRTSGSGSCALEQILERQDSRCTCRRRIISP